MNHTEDSWQPTNQTDDQAQTPIPIQPAQAEREISTNTQNETKEDKGTARELAREFRWFEVLSLIVNAVLAVVGIVALTIYHGQLTVMQGTLDQMRDGAKQTDKLIAESIKQSKAASDGARAAQDNVSAVERGMRQDQRPWLKVELVPDFESDGRKVTTTITIGKPLVIPIRIRNTRKTPGVDVRSAFAIQIAGPTDKLFLPPDMTNPPHVEHLDDYRLKAGRILWRLKVALRLKTPEDFPADSRLKAWWAR